MTDRELMQQALEALEQYTSVVTSVNDPNSWVSVSDGGKPAREAIAALRAAIEQAQDPETELETYKRLYELRGKALERPCSNCGHQPAKIKAMAQTGSAQSGLAEKIPAKGTLLEQTLKDVWDEMPHTALMDAIIGGTGVMLGDKRIDPASIYKQPEQEPVAWVNPKWLNPKTRHWTNDTILHKPIAGWVPLYTAPRQWQGLTNEELKDCEKQAMVNGALPFEQRSFFARAIEAKLKEKNT